MLKNLGLFNTSPIFSIKDDSTNISLFSIRTHFLLLKGLILREVDASAVGAFSLIGGVLAERDVELRSSPLVGLAHFPVQTKPDALAKLLTKQGLKTTFYVVYLCRLRDYKTTP